MSTTQWSRRPSWFRRVGWAGLVAGALMLSACGADTGSDTTDTGGTADDPTPISVALQPNVNYAALFTGLDKGVFLKHGVDLKVSIQTSIPSVGLAVQSGQSQVGAGTAASVVPANVQGLPQKIFLPLIGRPDVVNYDDHQGIIVRGDVNAASVADLRGKKIAVSLGGGTETYLRAQLRKAGLDATKDVQLVNVKYTDMVAAMTSKTVDAAATSEPWGSLIIAKVSGSKALIRGGETTSIRVGLFADNSWMQKNADLLDRFVAAVLESSQIVRTDPAAAAQATANYLTDLDPTVLAAAIKILSYDPRWTDQVQQGYAAERQDMITGGGVKDAPPLTDLLALDVLTNYEKKYPEYFSDLKK